MGEVLVVNENKIKIWWTRHAILTSYYFIFIYYEYLTHGVLIVFWFVVSVYFGVDISIADHVESQE